MEIDLYQDLTAFNALTPDHRKAESEQRAATARNKPQPPVIVAQTPAFDSSLVVEPPGTVTLSAEDLMCESDEQSESTQPEDSDLKVKMDDQLKVSGALADPSPSNNISPAAQVTACLACGHESNGEDLFCISCGTFLTESEMEVQVGPACIDCGSTVEPGEVFCPTCGSALPG
jgi:hypothetical protein